MSLRDQWRPALAFCLVLLALQQLTGAGIIKAKAWLAPLLIEKAWVQSSSSGGAPVRPWPWADTWPVARLQVPVSGIDLLILAGDTGNALAFGPGHTSVSSLPGERGTVVISGHRDTHFAFLQDLKPGTTLRLQSANGISRTYRVNTSAVVDADRQRLKVAAPEDRLLLVTCYPFSALQAGGPLRYVVSAIPVDEGPWPINPRTQPPEVFSL